MQSQMAHCLLLHNLAREHLDLKNACLVFSPPNATFVWLIVWFRLASSMLLQSPQEQQGDTIGITRGSHVGMLADLLRSWLGIILIKYETIVIFNSTCSICQGV